MTARFEMKTGSILDSKADAIVNSVCCIGMVAGLAEAIIVKYKDTGYGSHYVEICELGLLQVGKPFLYDLAEDDPKLANPRYIISFPSHYAPGPSRISEVRQGLKCLRRQYEEDVYMKEKDFPEFCDIGSIAFPGIGCGLGGLQWPDVEREIRETFADAPNLTVELYPPLNWQQQEGDIK